MGYTADYTMYYSFQGRNLMFSKSVVYTLYIRNVHVTYFLAFLVIYEGKKICQTWSFSCIILHIVYSISLDR